MIIELLIGAAVSAPFAFAAWKIRSVTARGAIVGVFLGGVVYAGMYLAGLAVLAVALVCTIASTRAGRDRKLALGIAEQHGGQRGAANILANCLVGTSAAVVEVFSPDLAPGITGVWFVSGIAAGASDSVASELGKAWGGTPRAFPTWRRVPAGTPGAVSAIGTIAGMMAAAVIALPATALWLMPSSYIAIVVVACSCGAFLESLLATFFERAIGNEVLNVLNTACAAAIAAVLVS
jgi:uncharacterized protein (TIGR00297 family)